MHSVVRTMMMARQWRQRWSGSSSGGGAEAVERQRQQRWRLAPAAATTTATTTMTMAVAAVAKATVMATAAASGRHGESSFVLAAGARMETSDKFRGEPVDCCLCLCPPPLRCCRRVAAVVLPLLRCRHCHPRRCHPCCRCHRRCHCCRRLMVGRWREDGRQRNKWRQLWMQLQYAQNCQYDNVG
jgi:hypothetical protein